MLHYNNKCLGILLYLFPELLVQYFSSSCCNYLCKALVMYRIIDKAGSEHIVSTMQGNSVITYVLHSKMCIQKLSCLYNRTSDW